MEKFASMVMEFIAALINPVLVKAAEFFGWTFNLPVRVGRSGKVLFNRGTKIKGTVVPSDVLIARYNECIEKKEHLKEVELEAAARKGKKDTLLALYQAWDNCKKTCPPEMKGRPMKEYPEGLALMTFRNELRADDPELTQAFYEFMSVYSASEKENNELLSHFSLCSLGNTAAVEAFRILNESWAVKAANKAARNERAILGKFYESGNTNGTYTDDDRSEIDPAQEEYNTVISCVANFLTAEEVRDCEGNATMVLETVKRIAADSRAAGRRAEVLRFKERSEKEEAEYQQVSKEAKKAWAIAHALWPLYSCQETFDGHVFDLNKFGEICGFENYDEAKAFVDEQNDAAVHWKACSDFNRVKVLKGNLKSLALENNYSMFKIGVMANVVGDWKEEVLLTPANELCAAYFGTKAGNWDDKVIPIVSRVNKSLNAEQLRDLGKSEFYKMKAKEKKVVYEEAAEHLKNNPKARKELLSTKDWKFETQDATWNKFLTDFRNELRAEQKKVEQHIDESTGKLMEGAEIRPDSEEVLEQARVNKAWEIINKNADIVRETMGL